MWLTWIIEGRIAASGMLTPRDATRLVEEGITAVLSLTELNPFEAGSPEGLSHLHLPIRDMTAPTPEDLLRAVRFIRREDESRHRVLVHCGAGLGRTGTVLACYLVSEGEEPGTAIQRIRAARPGSVETAEQAAAVWSFPQIWRHSRA